MKIIATDNEIFCKATDEFGHIGAKCPKCSADGKLSRHGDYARYLVSFEINQVICRLVKPLRFRCASCKSTHALLPDIVTPYSPYSLRFKLMALIAYYERDCSVAAVCEEFNVAVSTLYEWKKLMLNHKGLMLGVLISLKTSALEFLRNLTESIELSRLLEDFFKRHNFSFMQNRAASATHSPPP